MTHYCKNHGLRSLATILTQGKLIMPTFKILFALTFLYSMNLSAATINFTSLTNSSGYGNVLTTTQSGITVTLSAYSETGLEDPLGSGFYKFQTAEIFSHSTGIGICNRNEGTMASGCTDDEFEIDTLDRDDLLVMTFDQNVNFESVFIDPFDGVNAPDPNDRDIVYWTGNIGTLPDLTNQTFNTLATLSVFGSEKINAAITSYTGASRTLIGTGNVLLLSGKWRDRLCSGTATDDTACEAYHLTSINVSPATSPVPVPAAVWLFGSALAGLFGFSRRNITA